MVKFLSLISTVQWKKRSSTLMKRAREGRRRRRYDFVAPDIPFDLMIEILRRLPAKSLMRFKCVSKLWFGLIRSRYFCNLYLTKKVSSSSSPRLYMSLIQHYTCDSLELCQTPGKSELVSLRISSSELLEPDLTFPGMGGYNMVVLRGLILYTVCRKACIYNPATRQSLTLPAVKSNIFAQQEPEKYLYYLFGHDHVLDQYKIVCIVVALSKVFKTINTEYWVLVLGTRGLWKRIKYDDQPHTPTKEGICINGVIYYLAFSLTRRDNIYCFDVRSEKLSKIQVPHEVSEFCERVGFMNHFGKPALFDYTHIIETGVSELWVLEDGLGGTWSRKSLVLKPCQRHLVKDLNIMKLAVYGTSQNNEVILGFPCPCYLFYYDLIKNDLRKVNINREMPPDYKPNAYVKVMDKSESIMHLET